MARTQLSGDNVLNDSLTGLDVHEESLVLEKIPFSNVGFVALNTKDAIIEAKQSGSIFDVNKILTGWNTFDVLVDSDGNVLEGV